MVWVYPPDYNAEHVNIPRNKQLNLPGTSTPQNTFFTEQLPAVALKCQLFFSKNEKPKKNLIPPEAVVRRCSVNKGVLKNFTKLTGKHLCQSLSFNKFVGLRLWHKCFSVNFWKISIAPILKKTFRDCFYCSSVLDTLETL